MEGTRRTLSNNWDNLLFPLKDERCLGLVPNPNLYKVEGLYLQCPCKVKSERDSGGGICRAYSF